MDKEKELRLLLREIRKMKGMRQEDVSELLGLAPNAVNKMEQGERKITAVDLLRMIKIYGVDPNYVVRRIG